MTAALLQPLPAWETGGFSCWLVNRLDTMSRHVGRLLSRHGVWAIYKLTKACVFGERIKLKPDVQAMFTKWCTCERVFTTICLHSQFCHAFCLYITFSTTHPGNIQGCLTHLLPFNFVHHVNHILSTFYYWWLYELCTFIFLSVNVRTTVLVWEPVVSFQ